MIGLSLRRSRLVAFHFICPGWYAGAGSLSPARLGGLWGRPPHRQGHLSGLGAQGQLELSLFSQGKLVFGWLTNQPFFFF